MPPEFIADQDVRKYMSPEAEWAYERGQAAVGQFAGATAEYAGAAFLAFLPELTSKAGAVILAGHATDQMKQLFSSDGKGYFQTAQEYYYGNDNPYIRPSVLIWDFSTVPLYVGAGLPPQVQAIKLSEVTIAYENGVVKAVTPKLNPGSVSDIPSVVPTTCQDAAKNLDKLSASGKLLDPADKGGNLTRAGRALQKHGSDQGKRATSNAFPKPRGNPSQINQQGQDVLDDILTNPGSITKPGNRFGGVDTIAPDGRAARFDANGQFRGFLEP